MRYTAVGGAATAVHYALLAALVEALRWPPAPAAALGALCGAAVAYAGNRRFTFAGGGGAAHGRAAPRFLAVAALGVACNALLVWAFTTALREHYLVAQAQATAAGLLLTYVLNKRWTFAT